MAEDRGVGPGVVSLVCAFFSLAGAIAGFCSCGGTLLGAVPFAIAGLVAAYFASGSMRLCGYAMNGLALMACVAAVLFILGFCVGPSVVAPLAPVPEQTLTPAPAPTRPAPTTRRR